MPASAFVAVRLRSIPICIFLLAVASLSSAQIAVTTNHYDNARTGQNLQETFLTTANVNSSTFGQLFTLPVDGYIVGHPLYVPNVAIPGLGTHNVVYVATMHDSVYAFDADSPSTPLWQISFTNPAAGITSVPISDQACYAVTNFPEFGVLSTPVIDPVAQTMYVVAKTEENGSFVHRIHALDLATGQEKPSSPVQVAASVVSNGITVPFVDRYQMNRPGLLLTNGVLYVAFGTEGCKYSMAASGWVMAYDASKLTQLGVFDTNPNQGFGSGIWQGGAGLAADSANNIYFNTADGPYDADEIHFGDSLLKLTLGDTLTWADYFTPYNQNDMWLNDLDLGSGGVVLLPDQSGAHPHEMVSIGKLGTIYLVDRDNLGKYNPNGDSNIVQELPFATDEVDGVPIYWNNTLLVYSENDFIKAFSIANGQLSSVPAYKTTFTISHPQGAALSANGNSNAILWITSGMGAGNLNAFDATTLKKLFISNVGTVPHWFNPLVANGKVYVGTTNSLYVFGLLSSLSVNAGNNQSGVVGSQLPIALQVKASDPYTGNARAGVLVNFSDAGIGGKFSRTAVTTDSNGLATTNYMLPTRPATITITAAANGYLSTTLSETSVAGRPSSVSTKSGFGQSAPVNTTLPAPVCAIVKDVFKNAVPNVTVHFTDNGAGGKLSASNVLTTNAGLACVNYTTPGTAGSVTLSATVAGVSAPANFKETVTP
jgi:hypothetical protein